MWQTWWYWVPMLRATGASAHSEMLYNTPENCPNSCGANLRHVIVSMLSVWAQWHTKAKGARIGCPWGTGYLGCCWGYTVLRALSLAFYLIKTATQSGHTQSKQPHRLRLALSKLEALWYFIQTLSSFEEIVWWTGSGGRSTTVNDNHSQMNATAWCSWLPIFVLSNCTLQLSKVFSFLFY